MGKKKLVRFKENRNFSCLHQLNAKEILKSPHPFQGSWSASQFGNQNSIVLELGCGRGEYTLGLARLFPERNFIGCDIKGSRLFFGAKQVEEAGIKNAAFVRGAIDLIDRVFAAEIDEIWITFPDPYIEKPRKRLTSPVFLNKYRQALKPQGIISLKTDDYGLFKFTTWVARENGLKILKSCENLHQQTEISPEETIMTTYEQKFIAAGKAIHLLKFVLDREIKPI
ncbi:MAG: tRNA (guanosine(46)-N7)-methyltransferase TrmB [Candidatus Rifleibacteriota bacterium]